jgi:hypothetical protein
MEKLEITPITIFTGDSGTGKTFYLEDYSNFTWGIDAPVKFPAIFYYYYNKDKAIQFCYWLKKYFGLELFYKDDDSDKPLTFTAFKTYKNTVPYAGDFFCLGKSYHYLLSLFYSIFNTIWQFDEGYKHRVTFGICNIEAYATYEVMEYVLKGLTTLSKDYDLPCYIKFILETNNDIATNIMSKFVNENLYPSTDIIVYDFRHKQRSEFWNVSITKRTFAEEKRYILKNQIDIL